MVQLERREVRLESYEVQFHDGIITCFNGREVT